MVTNNDTLDDLDLLGEIRRCIAEALGPIERRLSALEANINLIIIELKPLHTRLSALEVRHTHEVLTPLPMRSVLPEQGGQP